MKSAYGLTNPLEVPLLKHIFYYIFLPSATYFFNDPKVGKKSFPQVPGRLIFREYPHRMLDMKWPVRDKGVSEGVAKRNRAENRQTVF